MFKDSLSILAIVFVGLAIAGCMDARGCARNSETLKEGLQDVSDTFKRLSKEACLDAGNAVAGAVSSGAALYRANDLVQNGPPGRYPQVLDGSADGPAGKKNPLFGNVLEKPITDLPWFKRGNLYIHTCDGESRSFTYNAQSGTFQ